METMPDRMQIPEYVKRELSEVYLLMDHIAGRKDKTLEQASAPPTTGGLSIELEKLCGLGWPPPDPDRAKTLTLVLTAKDRLSRAAYPATGYSVAFTYLSLANYVDAARRTPIRCWFARWCAQHGSRLPTAAADVTGPGAASSGGAGDVAASGLSDRSAMVQFARDAFPGLEFAQELPFDKKDCLFVVLFFLLLFTGLFSWDLAVGQRLLADYKWLSSNPQAIQIDKSTWTTPGICDPDQMKDLSKVGRTSCARFLAGERIVPIAERWISWQFVLRLLVDLGQKPQETPAYQGYVLEQTRVLVTILNYNILPVLLGSLAATAAALRTIATKIARQELEPRDLAQVWPRVLLGAFLGSMIGFFLGQGPSNGHFALAADADPTSTVALSPCCFCRPCRFRNGPHFPLARQSG